MDSTTPRPLLPVIEMSGISVGSRDNPDAAVLENVNWTVLPGEYWVIGGMHGAGKSPLLGLAAGLSQPLQGHFRLFGRETPLTADQFLSEGLRVGLVFDNGQLFHQLTVQENIALPLFYHRSMAKRELDDVVQRIMEWAGLSQFGNRLPGSLGRAWLKRAGLARSLVLQPEVLLLDNLLSGLDSRHLHWWLEALDELSDGRGLWQGRQLTLIAATDDFRPWRRRAAHFAVLQKGQFRVLGHHPQLTELGDPLVRELLAEPLSAA